MSVVLTLPFLYLLVKKIEESKSDLSCCCNKLFEFYFFFPRREKEKENETLGAFGWTIIKQCSIFINHAIRFGGGGSKFQSGFSKL